MPTISKGQPPAPPPFTLGGSPASADHDLASAQDEAIETAKDILPLAPEIRGEDSAGMMSFFEMVSRAESLRDQIDSHGDLPVEAATGFALRST